MKGEYAPTESAICIAYIDYIRAKYPHLVVIKIDNEGKTSWQLGRQKKREGKVKGAGDYFIAEPTTFYAGLWHEIKTHKGKPSKEQIEFGQQVVLRGYAFAISYSIDHAISTIDDYLAGGLVSMVETLRAHRPLA